MTKCPKCGEELIFSLMEKYNYCMNKECKGWYCFYCEKWHPYGTSCGRAGLAGFDIDDQKKYDKWCKAHKEDIFRMLKDSGYYNHWHEVDKYYLKDEGDYFKKELEELEDEL